MSLGTQALLLIRLDARAGHFVTVDELADHFGWPQEEVQLELQNLWTGGYIEVEWQHDPFTKESLVSRAIAKSCEGQPCA